MIIFGSRTAFVNSAPATRNHCPNCDTQNSLTINIYSRHAHVFWIPVFPFSKTAIAVCSHCKYAMYEKEMPEKLKDESNRIKKKTKGPGWQFSGAILFLLLISLGVAAGKSHQNSELEYLASPVAGDVYKYKIASKRYTTFRVNSVNIDSVFVNPNTYETDKTTGTYKIDKSENYLQETYGFSRTELDSMYHNNTIYGIIRP